MISQIFIGLVIIVVVFIICYCLVIRGRKETDAYYQQIDIFKEQAKKCNNLEELIQIHNKLAAYANEKAWNKYYSAAAREVLSYIKGKIEGLRELKNN